MPCWFRNARLALAVLLATGFWLSGLLCAQEQSPAAPPVLINGSVFDTAWKPIGGAEVSLINYSDCSVRSATTNAAGRYAFEDVAPGSYVLSILAAGFERGSSEKFDTSARGLQSRMHFLERAREPGDPEPCPGRSLKGKFVTSAVLRKQVPPRYPREMREQGIQGQVVFEAVIAKTGRVSTLRRLSAPHPMLADAAARALQQWRYSPTLLDGQPVAVITPLTVDFRLGGFP